MANAIQWTTPDADVRTSVRLWCESIGSEIFGMAVDTLCPDHFAARFDVRSFGGSDIIRVASSPQHLQRTKTAITSDGSDDIIVNLLLEGEVRFGQFGREDIACAGDCFVADSAMPYFHHFSLPLRTLSFRLPRPWVERHSPHVEDLSARRIDGASSWGRALAAYLLAIDEGGDSGEVDPTVMLEQGLQLLLMALAPARRETTTHQVALLRRAYGAIRERLGEEGLKPADVARTLGISRSYLHALFARESSSFCTVLENMRIAHSMTLLDGGDARLTIAEVAARSGFASAAHFSRKFHLAKAMTPTEYRRRH
ncbi:MULTISPECIES: helix-turn-helix domain-containing protein [unclassified Sphingobium]|uniref:helix-turn-helix domain-containing protein n=1 Tax=unclassified Sphingobium TaxID=2611147 RepID=UPI00076FE2B2|nr:MULTISPECIES: helix-turn-helix domain-containing protein [Sphingomonadaceae]AMK22750.1 AraC family transcriptional regulator [Sphingobium sp. TKS]NML90267.1 helix-turn-helix domain-containing protein [Sphingobium sp. TB-6]